MARWGEWRVANRKGATEPNTRNRRQRRRPKTSPLHFLRASLPAIGDSAPSYLMQFCISLRLRVFA